MADVRMTQEQLNETIKAAVEAGVSAALAARGPASPPVSFVEAGPDAQFEALQRDRLSKNPARPTTLVPNVLSDTGATFTAVIDHNGRVVRLDEYTHPVGVDVKVDQGGLVPQGYEIGGRVHAQWKWSTYWQVDIASYVGKPLKKHARAEAEERTATLAQATT